MGYTHYFKFAHRLSNENIEAMREIVSVVTQHDVFGRFVSKMPDADEWSGIRNGKGQDGKAYVSINGYCTEDGRIDLGHENLVAEEGDERGGVKTARKPYDLTVVAILTAWQLKEFVKETSSDGDVDDFARNWRAALQYSVEECLSCYFDDEDVIRLYGQPPTTDEAWKAFEKVIEELDEVSMPATPRAAERQLAAAEPTWF